MPVNPMARSARRPGTRWSLRRWRRSIPGRRLLAAEEAELRRILPELFGELCLLVGDWGEGERMLQGAIHFRRRASVAPLAPDAEARCSPEQLPFLDKSADLIVLQHVIEYCDDPRQALREAVRVLSDRGVLIVLGRNPLSIAGLRHALGLEHRAVPAGARLVRAGRVCDWLEVLGLSIEVVRRFAPARSRVSRLLAGPLEGLLPLYLLMARKRVRPLTAVRSPLRPRLRAVSGGLAMPEARTGRTPAMPEPR